MNYKSPYPFLAIVFLFLVVASNEFEINQQDLFDNSSGNSTYNDQKLPYPSIINYNQINAPCIYTAKKKKKNAETNSVNYKSPYPFLAIVCCSFEQLQIMNNK